MKVTGNSLENGRYRVTLDANGDVSSIFDKRLANELLASPLRLAFQTEKPEQWPAWNMDWADQQKPPRAYVSGPVQIRISESGPVRVALEVSRQAEGSKVVGTVRLSAGDAGNRVEFGNVIDWKSSEAALKATFFLTASNSVATYNWDTATIQRSNNNEQQFEVPSHQFIDLTDKAGSYGVTVLTDCKNGSDKPADNSLRLTLIYTPGISNNGRSYSDQATQDWGHHEFIYGLVGHTGDWRSEQTDWQALRLNQPLIAMETQRHRGVLGKQFSLVKVSSSRLRVMALKKAEEGNEFIVRLVEADGKNQPAVHVSFPSPVTSAREVNGQEQATGDAQIEGGDIVTAFKPYQIHTFAFQLGSAPIREKQPLSQPVTLAYDRNVVSTTGSKSNGGFDAEGRALPAEMLPSQIEYGGIGFALGPANAPNAVTAQGQQIALPARRFNRVYILAAASGGDRSVIFKAGDKPVTVNVEDWGGYIGQWDNRTWTTKQVPNRWRPLPADIKPDSDQGKTILAYQREHPTHEEMQYTGLTPGFIKRAPVAWYASHRHSATGENEPYSYSYLFAYELDLPPGARTLTLPNDGSVRILAVTAADCKARIDPAQPLYDTLGR